MTDKTGHRFVLCGWGLFMVSALFFIWAALRAGDTLALMGAIFFLVACIAFMIPLFAPRRPDDE